MKKLYVIARYYQVPKNKNRTFEKGFGKNSENMIFDESVAIARTIKTRDLTEANVILNLTDERVEKCNLRPDANFHDLLNYYQKNYPQYFQHTTPASATTDEKTVASVS
jgi:hypothetical protein